MYSKRKQWWYLISLAIYQLTRHLASQDHVPPSPFNSALCCVKHIYTPFCVLYWPTICINWVFLKTAFWPKTTEKDVNVWEESWNTAEQMCENSKIGRERNVHLLSVSAYSNYVNGQMQ